MQTKRVCTSRPCKFFSFARSVNILSHTKKNTQQGVWDRGGERLFLATDTYHIVRQQQDSLSSPPPVPPCHRLIEVMVQLASPTRHTWATRSVALLSSRQADLNHSVIGEGGGGGDGFVCLPRRCGRRRPKGASHGHLVASGAQDHVRVEHHLQGREVGDCELADLCAPSIAPICRLFDVIWPTSRGHDVVWIQRCLDESCQADQNDVKTHGWITLTILHERKGTRLKASTVGAHPMGPPQDVNIMLCSYWQNREILLHYIHFIFCRKSEETQIPRPCAQMTSSGSGRILFVFYFFYLTGTGVLKQKCPCSGGEITFAFVLPPWHCLHFQG